MINTVTSLDDAREKRIDGDSALAKRLIGEAHTAAEQLTRILAIGLSEINDPQQLKALVDEIKRLTHDKIVDKALGVEIERSLDKIRHNSK